MKNLGKEISWLKGIAGSAEGTCSHTRRPDPWKVGPQTCPVCIARRAVLAIEGLQEELAINEASRVQDHHGPLGRWVERNGEQVWERIEPPKKDPVYGEYPDIGPVRIWSYKTGSGYLAHCTACQWGYRPGEDQGWGDFIWNVQETAQRHVQEKHPPALPDEMPFNVELTHDQLTVLALLAARGVSELRNELPALAKRIRLKFLTPYDAHLAGMIMEACGGSNTVYETLNILGQLVQDHSLAAGALTRQAVDK